MLQHEQYVIFITYTPTDSLKNCKIFMALYFHGRKPNCSSCNFNQYKKEIYILFVRKCFVFMSTKMQKLIIVVATLLHAAPHTTQNKHAVSCQINEYKHIPIYIPRNICCLYFVVWLCFVFISIGHVLKTAKSIWYKQQQQKTVVRWQNVCGIRHIFADTAQHLLLH